ELFEAPAVSEPNAPLATRLRPRRFDQLVGQRRVGGGLRGPNGPGHRPRLRLWGPPGSGESTPPGHPPGERTDPAGRQAPRNARDGEDLRKIVERGASELGAAISADGMDALLEGARGDARVALNGLETAAALAAGQEITLNHVERALQEGHLLYDRAGDQHYD